MSGEFDLTSKLLSIFTCKLQLCIIIYFIHALNIWKFLHSTLSPVKYIPHNHNLSFSLSENVGDLLIEGKTKKIHLLKSDPNTVVVINKDRITAGDGARAHDLKGKAEIATKTNTLVFDILNAAGKLSTQVSSYHKSSGGVYDFRLS
jgi:Phosphoribosylaminoimidazolesuccinocarboxamide (SAICAR) synthase